MLKHGAGRRAAGRAPTASISHTQPAAPGPRRCVLQDGRRGEAGSVTISSLVQRKSNFRLRLHRPYAFPKTEIHSTCVPHLCGPTENLSEISQSVTASRS